MDVFVVKPLAALATWVAVRIRLDAWALKAVVLASLTILVVRSLARWVSRFQVLHHSLIFSWRTSQGLLVRPPNSVEYIVGLLFEFGPFVQFACVERCA